MLDEDVIFRKTKSTRANPSVDCVSYIYCSNNKTGSPCLCGVTG